MLRSHSESALYCWRSKSTGRSEKARGPPNFVILSWHIFVQPIAERFAGSRATHDSCTLKGSNAQKGSGAAAEGNLIHIAVMRGWCVVVLPGLVISSPSVASGPWTTPAYCNRSFLEVKDPVPVPSKRYAVALNRHCYRGFSGLDYKRKNSYIGTDRAVDVQLALINSFVQNVIMPLEHEGYEVDVFIVAHDPAPRNRTQSSILWDLLLRPFGSRLVAATKLRGARGKSRDEGQAAAMAETFRLIEKEIITLVKKAWYPGHEAHISPYRAVLISRFDVAFTDRLGPPTSQKKHYPVDAAHYAQWSAVHPRFVMDMVASIPGWLLGCYLSHILHSPDMPRKEWWTETGTGRTWHPRILETALAGIGNNRDWFPSQDGFFIYRGPYGASHHDGGKFICRWLREYYGGPSCGVTYVAGDTCGASITFRENATLALTALYATAQDEDRPRGKALKKLVASRPEWYLSPRPDEATPGSLEDFLKDVACGSHDDAVRRKSMRDGFIAGTPLVPYPLDRSN